MIPAAPRQLFVCCDGTWFSPEARAPSHVGRIAKLAATRPGGERDLVYYTRGVGSRYGLDKWIGGGLGEGIDTNVKDAYNFLAHNYIPPSDDYPGDKIFMFGFSRGAYTVRSVAAMIDKVGLLRRGSVMSLGDAYRVYRTRPGKTAIDKDTGKEIDLAADVQPVEIQFVGVFDTVGARGIPFIGLDQTRRFTDLELPSRVKHARHAMALNEPRSQFRPAVWEGVRARPEDADDGNAPPRIVQAWFAGVHSDVGGGYARSAMGNRGHLGSHTLAWMLQEASACGLKFDSREASAVIDGLEPDAPEAVANARNFILHDSMSILYLLLDKLLYLQRLIWDGDLRFHRRYVEKSAAVSQSIHESAATAFLRDATLQPGDPVQNSILLRPKWPVNRRLRRFRFSRNVELRAVASKFSDHEPDDPGSGAPESRVFELDTVVRPASGNASRAARIVAAAALFMGLAWIGHEHGDWISEELLRGIVAIPMVAAMALLSIPYLLHKRLYSYRFLR